MAADGAAMAHYPARKHGGALPRRGPHHRSRWSRLSIDGGVPNGSHVGPPLVRLSQPFPSLNIRGHLAALRADHGNPLQMLHNQKVIVVLPAYCAAATLEQTVPGIPMDVVDEVLRAPVTPAPCNE